jgi:carbamate kinase
VSRRVSRVPDRLLIAVGGNAIHPAGIRGTPEEQTALAAATARALRPIMGLGTELVVTHGNGPGVGKILMRQAIARHRVAPASLDMCVADSQGEIAYLLLQAFENALREVGDPRPVVCLLTEVEVDPEDPGLRSPTKPVGYFFTEAEARALAAELGWAMREDAGRGWRLVVPSPAPKAIVNIAMIEAMARQGAVVIAGGGGGIPVARGPGGVLRGVEAVIDKDLTSALMANRLGVDTLMILTAVSRVAVHFGTPRRRDLDRVSLAELRRYRAEGHFPDGSMGPKIEAAIRFLEGGGRRVIIGHLEEALPALRGETGTHVLAGGD